MGTLYENIIALCNEHGIKGGKMCSDLGISKGILTDLKAGRKKGVSAATADKIASYFGVSVGYLLGTEHEKTPTLTVKDERSISDEDLMAAFFDGAGDLTKEEMAEMWEDARDYMQYKLAQKRRKNNG